MRLAAVPVMASLLLLAALVPAMTVTAATEAVVQVPKINLRSSPNTDSRVLAVLEKGTQTVVLDRKSGWLKVRYGDRIGYLRDRENYVRMMDSDSPEMTDITQAGKTQDDDIGRQVARSKPKMPDFPGPKREFAGVIYPMHDIALSMGVSGLVASVAIHLGDEVRQGQLLLQLDDAAQKIEAERRLVIFNNRAELNSLEKRIRRTRSLMEDVRQLYETSGSVSLDEVTRAELEFFTLQGRYDELSADKARERLEHQAAQKDQEMRRLYAPISGFITHLGVDKGEWVNPGKVLAQLVDTSSGILRLAVPESVAQPLRPGYTFPIWFEAYPETTRTSGEITFVSAAADPASGLVQVEITFDNRKLGIRPGGKGYALLPSVRIQE
ncbi:hypothetical protein DSCO28_34470 [Desulfosarcina ovata subsp. sediminis]|uniref:SH3b domain-containing protein n=2 Tax=Desulfosarcina ovata TaxID=83564 RepID=A0A5K7ZNQ4_9BACT|nr:hypothetical protein DSCO28_34470 [Desulfosarcina ovata subsp. sediminis]